jgi:hypothetical protein
MKRRHTLVLPAKLADELRAHLFPGDGLEAAALLLCTVTGERRSKWLGREVIRVPRRLYTPIRFHNLAGRPCGGGDRQRVGAR